MLGFNLIRRMLGICSVPSIFYLFDKQLSKVECKNTFIGRAYSYIEAMWRAEVNEKPSLKYISIQIQ